MKIYGLDKYFAGPVHRSAAHSILRLSISVTSNVAPGLCRNMYVACRQGHAATAQRWAGAMAKLTAALYRETSPVPLKYALSLLGLMSPQVRLPLVELTDATKAEIADVITSMCENFADYMVGKPRTSANGAHEPGQSLPRPYANDSNRIRIAPGARCMDLGSAP